VIWLTWRQFRAQTWTALTVLAAAAVALAVTGPDLARMFDASGIIGCAARGDCGSLTTAFLNQVGHNAPDNVLNHLSPWVLFAVPSLIGMFWGAPLVTRELETGSFRMVWNQSVTRTRWLAVKLAVIGLASMATAGLLSLAFFWWSSPVERLVILRMTPGTFGATGIVPVGYAAFAFAVGVTAGILIRRTLPAMAVTLAVTVGAQFFMALWLRARLIAPLRMAVPLSGTVLSQFVVSPRTGRFTVFAGGNQPQGIPGAWILSSPQTITTPDHVASQACLQELNRNLASPPACIADLARLHLTQTVTYQPLSRYWTLQWYETGIFLGLALVLAAVCFWRVRRTAA
jgi:hypothetical protein